MFIKPAFLSTLDSRKKPYLGGHYLEIKSLQTRSNLNEALKADSSPLMNGAPMKEEIGTERWAVGEGETM